MTQIRRGTNKLSLKRDYGSEVLIPSRDLGSLPMTKLEGRKQIAVTANK